MISTDGSASHIRFQITDTKRWLLFGRGIFGHRWGGSQRRHCESVLPSAVSLADPEQCSDFIHVYRQSRLTSRPASHCILSRPQHLATRCRGILQGLILHMRAMRCTGRSGSLGCRYCEPDRHRGGSVRKWNIGRVEDRAVQSTIDPAPLLSTQWMVYAHVLRPSRGVCEGPRKVRGARESMS